MSAFGSILSSVSFKLQQEKSESTYQVPMDNPGITELPGQKDPPLEF